MLYAEVCVNTPLGARRGPGQALDEEALQRTFTYAVPDHLATRLQPGHLAWVPFRGRRLQAVVLELSQLPPQFDTREIIALVWALPLLNPVQISLAYWISDYYLAPLIESLRLMLPAGLSQRGRTVLARTAVPVPAGLTARQNALLERIASSAGDWATVSHGLSGVTQRNDLEPLIEAGLVNREVEFPSPPPRPKTDRQVRLLADEETIRRSLLTLGRASKQADVLAWLVNRSGCALPTVAGARPSGPPIRLEEVLAALGCSRAPVDALAKRGWVALTPRSSAQEPALVNLLLAPEDVPDAIVGLRGAVKHRAVLEALSSQDGAAWVGWIYAQTGADLRTLRDLEAAGLATVAEEMVWRDPLAGHEFKLDRTPVLTPEQQAVWDAVSGSVDGSAFLLHGVTGSGKTEIYLRAIAGALQRGRQAVMLVPEIALTPQTIRRFAARFPGKVTVWHSELSDGERFDVWRRVRTSHPAAQVVVGSRSALFLPFPDLGLVVVDEEHEPSYKQERTPRYHARTVALALGRLANAPVILGSATPALESYYSARRSPAASDTTLTLLSLPKRIRAGEWTASSEESDTLPPPDRSAHAGAPLRDLVAELPPVHVVDMRQELRAGNRGIFSRRLSAGLRHVLAAGQQAILYLNRRGTASFVLCRDCGHVETCPHCAVPLTFHGEGPGGGGGQLICHHCNRRYPVPTSCPHCGGRRIRYFGSGTERVEEAVKMEFPRARTLRWDRDVTGAKGAHDAILSRFIAHEADVLIGTQMIAKGLDLPLVTLVGVVAADTGLFLPDFRAAERTFQLLTQVAGRAGRSALGGEVVVQTYHPDHYAVVAASNHDYEGFYRQEIAFRREQGYPPLRRLARLIYYHGQRSKAQAEATRLAGELLRDIAEQGLSDTDLIGPAPCFFARQRGEYRWHIIVRSPDPVPLLRRLSLGPGWRLDVDPADLL